MEYMLTFQNTHHAVHGEKTLLQKEIPVNVMPLPSSLGNLCGICLRLDPADFQRGLAALKEANIPVEKIFTIEEVNGKKEYLLWNP